MAEDSSDFPGFMVVIDMPISLAIVGAKTRTADTALCQQKPIKFFQRYTVARFQSVFSAAQLVFWMGSPGNVAFLLVCLDFIRVFSTPVSMIFPAEFTGLRH